MEPHTFRPSGILSRVVLLPIHHLDSVHSHRTTIQQDAPTDDTTHIGIYGVKDGGLHFIDEVPVDDDLQHATIAALSIGEREAQWSGVTIESPPWAIGMLLMDARLRGTPARTGRLEWESRGSCVSFSNLPQEWDGSLVGLAPQLAF